MYASVVRPHLPDLLVYVLAVALAIALGAVIAIVPNTTEALGICLVVLVGPVLLIVGLARFDLLVIFLLFTRISLDALKSGEGTGSVSVAVGGLFIVTAAIYLMRVKRRTRMSPFTRALYFLSFTMFASMIASAYPATAASGASKVLAGTMMFDVLEQMLYQNPRLARRVVIATLASAVIPIILALKQAATGTGNSLTLGFNRVYGTAVTPTSLATYLLPILAILIAAATHPKTTPRIRKYCLLAIPIPLLVLYLTYTRSAWLVLILGIVYILWFLRRRWLIPFTVVIVALALLTPGVAGRFSDIETVHSTTGTTAAPNSIDWRLGYWQETLALVKGNWPTGIGLDVTEVIERSHVPPHNIEVQLYTETGVLGCIAGLMVIIGFIRTVRRRRRLATDWKTQVLAVATGAAGLMVLGEGLASNVMTQTIVYWYFAGALAWGLFSVDSRQKLPIDDSQFLSISTEMGPDRSIAGVLIPSS